MWARCKISIVILKCLSTVAFGLQSPSKTMSNSFQQQWINEMKSDLRFHLKEMKRTNEFKWVRLKCRDNCDEYMLFWLFQMSFRDKYILGERKFCLRLLFLWFWMYFLASLDLILIIDLVRTFQNSLKSLKQWETDRNWTYLAELIRKIILIRCKEIPPLGSSISEHFLRLVVKTVFNSIVPLRAFTEEEITHCLKFLSDNNFKVINLKAFKLHIYLLD